MRHQTLYYRSLPFYCFENLQKGASVEYFSPIPFSIARCPSCWTNGYRFEECTWILLLLIVLLYHYMRDSWNCLQVSNVTKLSVSDAAGLSIGCIAHLTKKWEFQFVSHAMPHKHYRNANLFCYEECNQLKSSRIKEIVLSKYIYIMCTIIIYEL